jgi:CheY-like chemotaxis protein
VQPGLVLWEVANLMKETLPKNIAIETMVPPELWPVRANPTQLHQVLMNLCLNARDAMPDGGRLSLSAQNREVDASDIGTRPRAKPGPHVCITVSDTGTGIAPEHLSHIFEAFFTTKAQGKGTGLGLSSVLRIVTVHGGFVEVLSEPGKGSTFEIYIPREAHAPGAGSGAVAPAAKAGSGEWILVADDEEPIRIALGQLLERQGYRVLTAANGEEARQLAHQNRSRLRVVITDMMMPVMDGLALVRSLRTLEPRIAIIVMSGIHQRENGVELAGLGVSEILMKPIEGPHLIAALQRQMARVRQ